jgi:hypothetical protein
MDNYILMGEYMWKNIHYTVYLLAGDGDFLLNKGCSLKENS